MGQEVALAPEVVRARLKALENLLDDLDAQFSPLALVRQRQGTGMWTSIPACAGFADAYRTTLSSLDTSLRDLRAQVATLRQNLADSAKALAATDQDIQDRLTALADRLAEGPPAPPGICTPYDVIPTTDPDPVATPEPTTTPAPGPSPTPSSTPRPGGGDGW